MENLQRMDLQLHQDHRELFRMLADFRDNRFVPKELFRNLKWRLERHFYTEEKALLLVCEAPITITADFYDDLFCQHDEILGELETANKYLQTHDTYKWAPLKEMLQSHLIFETNSLYKILDQYLEGAQIEKINETLKQKGNTGFYPIKQLRHFIIEKIPACKQE